MNPNYYAIIPASVRYDNRLKANAKLLYGEITSLTQRDGYCWADNSYFADLYHVDHKTISRWISQLFEYGYIDVELLKSQGNKRKITIDKKVTSYTQKSHEVVTKKSLASDKKVTSIYENNKINNKKNRESTALGFFESNFPEQFSILMMQYKKQIIDFVSFSESFEATVEQEGLQFELHVLSGRFKKYAQNWIRNQKKYDVVETSKPIQNNNSDRVIGGF
jgi:hypothetical protein